MFLGVVRCGKSTLLRLIAGLEDVTSGSIFLDEKDLTQIPPSKRGLAMVFQSYALYHMSVRKIFLSHCAWQAWRSQNKINVLKMQLKFLTSKIILKENLVNYLEIKATGSDRPRYRSRTFCIFI